MFPLQILAERKFIFVGWIMSSPDGDGNVCALLRSCHSPNRTDCRGTISQACSFRSDVIAIAGTSFRILPEDSRCTQSRLDARIV
jgi:hypothetical protein